MNLLEKAAAKQLKMTGEKKKLSVPGQVDDKYEVFEIPLEHLYYNDQNGRINTTYKKYKAEHGSLTPEAGDSKYNEVFEQFIFESNRQALKGTLQSIKEKGQQEPGVVLPDGRVIDGNRRFTALRKFQDEDGIPKVFNAVILNLNVNSKTDEKTIKELELDLQLGREERISYDPIDRIFDVYNTIEVDKLMTKDEYKRASGAGTVKGINRDLRLAKLILRFIGIVSPGGNPVDKFYLARDLKLDGPIEEIESTLTNLKSSNKESIVDAVLVNLAVTKTNSGSKDATRIMRDLKTNVIRNTDVIEYYLPAVDEKVDTIIETFEENPIKTANDIKSILEKDVSTREAAEKLTKSTNRLIYKGKNDSKRKKALLELEVIRDNLEEIHVDDFKELTTDESLDAKVVLTEITDILHKLKINLKRDLKL